MWGQECVERSWGPACVGSWRGFAHWTAGSVHGRGDWDYHPPFQCDQMGRSVFRRHFPPSRNGGEAFLRGPMRLGRCISGDSEAFQGSPSVLTRSLRKMRFP